MEIIEVSCAYCGKKIYVLDEYTRNRMYCTLSCLDLDSHHPLMHKSIDILPTRLK